VLPRSPSNDVLHVIISHTAKILVFIALETSDLIQNNILGNSTDRLPTWKIDGLSPKGERQVATYGLSVSRSPIHFGVEVLYVKIKPIIFCKSFVAFSGDKMNPDLVNFTRLLSLKAIPIMRFLWL
jgi:hypothetical protein